jgi:hypothetical protein
LLIVEIEERFLRYASRRVRSEANAKKMRRLASVGMTWFFERDDEWIVGWESA